MENPWTSRRSLNDPSKIPKDLMEWQKNCLYFWKQCVTSRQLFLDNKRRDAVDVVLPPPLLVFLYFPPLLLLLLLLFPEIKRCHNEKWWHSLDFLVIFVNVSTNFGWDRPNFGSEFGCWLNLVMILGCNWSNYYWIGDFCKRFWPEIGQIPDKIEEFYWNLGEFGFKFWKLVSFVNNFRFDWSNS